VYCDNRKIEVTIDPAQSYAALLKYLCKQYSIYYIKPFKLTIGGNFK
jgi:hypothetical protein